MCNRSFFTPSSSSVDICRHTAECRSAPRPAPGLCVAAAVADRGGLSFQARCNFAALGQRQGRGLLITDTVMKCWQLISRDNSAGLSRPPSALLRTWMLSIFSSMQADCLILSAFLALSTWYFIIILPAFHSFPFVKNISYIHPVNTFFFWMWFASSSYLLLYWLSISSCHNI